VFTPPEPDYSAQMVNGGFPERARHGFERVDAAAIPFFTENLHQSKIYTESNQSDFSQIFDDLTSMQTLAIYRRLLVKDQLRDHPQRKRKTRPGSRDVFSAPHGILARAGARAIAQREDA
jgi:hypothetical protein